MEDKKITLTAEQKAVIENRGGDLLVAAAAGSGKTKVLVDRIMNRICNDEKKITDFVVITYTKAAAAELRAKITAELSKRLASESDPEKAKHIQAQLRLIYTAHISTVHSFCSDILHAYAAAAGLPTDFRIGEEQECQILRSAAMEEMLEGIYKDIEKRPNIKSFIEELAYGRDDSAVPAIIYSIYNTTQSHPWPEKWAKECVDNMDISRYTTAEETPWGSYIMDSVKTYIASQMPAINEALRICDADEVLAVNYSPAISADLAKLTAMIKCESWDEMCNLIDSGWEKLKPIRSKKVEVPEALQEEIKDLRKKYKQAIEDRAKSIKAPAGTKDTETIGRSAEVLSDLKRTESSVKGMFELVTEFTKRYREKKELHNTLDFSDLEHETIKLLLNEETEEKTEVAESIAKQFVEIMVDEYQDTNGVQETIFKALSSGNLFMVGDVKQSIYSFRLAEPEIFQSHYTAYPGYEDAEDGEPRKILLTKNFRSRAGILDATNAVMEECMSGAVGGIDYTYAEALVPGREDFIPSDEPDVELCAINMDSAPDRADDEDGLAKADVEAKYVAERVAELLKSGQIQDESTGELRSIQPKDIAILMRSTKTASKHYVKALAEKGIACSTARSGSILDTTEVATLYAFLQVVDNPMQDIPLVAVLASPLIGMTADDLAKIRICKKDAANFFSATQAYAEKDSRAAAFCKDLTELREMMPYTTLSRLFTEILERTEAEDVFGSMQNGALRMANIHKFSEMISSYEAGGAHGLFEFLCHIEALREQGAELPQAAETDAEDAVHILTVHASKGLEYPVVILSDLSRRFNMSDLKASALLHKKLGAGVQVVDKELGYRYPTIARTAISMATTAEAKSEELRILYVAMTRAKQKLIMTYCDKLGRTLEKLAGNITEPLSPAVSQSVINPGEWVLMTAMTRAESDPLYAMAGLLPKSASPSEKPWKITCVEAADIGGETATMEELESVSEDDAESFADDSKYAPLDTEAIEESFRFLYEHAAATTMPAKAVATTLYHEQKVTIRRPDFAKAKSGFTAAEKGTATHLFMRYVNFGACVRDGEAGVREEIARMKIQGFLSPSEADAVIVPALVRFFGSEVGKSIAAAAPASMKREYPFSLTYSAKELLADGEAPDDNILVQGIVDMFIEEEDGIILYDFKTDFIGPDDDIRKKAESYAGQVQLYAKALETIYGKPVKKKELIFLRTGETVAV